MAARGSRKGHSGNPAKAARQGRLAAAARAEASRTRSTGPTLWDRLNPFSDGVELALSEAPAWTRWTAWAGLVLAILVVAYSWFAMTHADQVSALAWLLLVVSTGMTLVSMVGMLTERDTWVMAGIIMSAAAPTGNLYLLNALALTCGISVAWGLSRSGHR